jgi:rare lipoprotein A
MLSRKAFGVVCVAVMAAALPQKRAYAAFQQCGIASYYDEDYLTATGERYKPDGISAAHRTLPLGSIVRVRHQKTGREVVVRINDRGPYVKGRIIDLSRGAKHAIGMDGLAPVCITVIGRLDRKIMVKHAKADTSIPTNPRRGVILADPAENGRNARRASALTTSEAGEM